jgi:hypothetical protein
VSRRCPPRSPRPPSASWPRVAISWLCLGLLATLGAAEGSTGELPGGDLSDTQARAELQRLLRQYLPLARSNLEEDRGLYPFGAALLADGTPHLYTGYTGDEAPQVNDVLSLLTDGFRRDAANGELRAVCVFVDVLVSPPDEEGQTDALQARLEHAAGLSISVYYPYSRAEDGTVRYRAPFTLSEPHGFFVGR